ncbi:Glu/Leu/Phe/Val dehydrogenase [bacterium]|nr:Glu/Leu/Phe/Val dehydrogenase [bacterium]
MARQSAEELDAAKTVLIRDRREGLEAMVVVDDVACGPSIGGIRMAPDVTLEEVARLARAMTLKNAAAGLPHGGGKAGIVADPLMPAEKKERLVRAFGRAIRGLDEYIPGPDMGTDERCMAYLHDEIGRAAGLPRVLGGIPLDEIGATGFGLACCAEVAADYAGIALRGARVAVQGFGAVGRHGARFLAERGALLVAAADSGGAVVNPDGLDLAALIAFKEERRSVRDFPGGRPLASDDLVAVDCDIWIPAARPDVLRADNAERLRARLVLQGANVPATAEAEARLDARGIVSVPDFIANAGGVICAAVEVRHGSQAEAFAVIADKIRDNTRAVLERARQARILPRAAADELARQRLEEAASYRRHR